MACQYTSHLKVVSMTKTEHYIVLVELGKRSLLLLVLLINTLTLILYLYVDCMCYTVQYRYKHVTREELFAEVFLYFTESSDEENDEDNNEEDEGNNEEEDEEEEEEEEEDEDKKSDKSQRRSYYLREHKPRTQLFEVPIGKHCIPYQKTHQFYHDLCVKIVEQGSISDNDRL